MEKVGKIIDSVFGTIFLLIVLGLVPMLIKVGATVKDSLCVMYIALVFLWLLGGDNSGRQIKKKA